MKRGQILTKSVKLQKLSITDLARLTGKDRATIASRLTDIKPIEDGGRAKYYDPKEALPAIFAVETFKGLQRKTEMVQFEIEKEKLHKIKIQNDKEAGKLVPIEEVCKTVEKEYSFVKAQISALPNKLSKPLSMESDVAIINSIISDAIDDAYAELTAASKYEQHLKEFLQNDNEINPTTNSSTGNS